MITFFKLLSAWPLWLLQAIGAALGWSVFLASPVYRRRFVRNTRLAGMSWQQVRGAVAESGKLVAELPRLWFGPSVKIVWNGAEHVQEALAKGSGVVFLTPHLGCFEITAQAYAQRFGHAGKPMTVLFRPPRQAWLRKLVSDSRQKPGLHTAPTTLAGVKQMIKALKQGESVGLLPDQVPPEGMGMMAPFFGHEAYTMTLSARLVQQTGATVLLAWGERMSCGRGYCVHVQPVVDKLPVDLLDAVTAINQAMESLILQCPRQYLWGYARYKRPRQILAGS